MNIKPKSNLQFQGIFREFDVEDAVTGSFPKDASIEVNMINGKKEGKAVVISERGLPLAELNYKNDKLEGKCLFFNEYGERKKEISFINGIAEGMYFEFRDNSICKMGIYKNGIIICELRKHPKYPDFLEEIVNSNVISVCKYSIDYKKHGLCQICENDHLKSVVRYENGIEKELIYAF